MNNSKYKYLSSLNSLLPQTANSKIFFLHMPKCGGTSIYRAIRDSYGFIEKAHGRNIFGLDPVASLKSSKIVGEPLREHRERLLLYHMSKESQRLIYGHFFYSQASFDAYGSDWNFITILRNPVSKWFSQYFYNRYKDSNHFKLDIELEKFLDSDESISMGRDYVYNLTDRISQEKASSMESINQAISNLQNFAIVGLLEKIEEFANDYETHFSAKLSIKNHNRNPLSKVKQEKMVSSELIQRVEEICQPNTAVYNSILAKKGLSIV